jgi:CBS domain-containing protein
MIHLRQIVKLKTFWHIPFRFLKSGCRKGNTFMAFFLRNLHGIGGHMKIGQLMIFDVETCQVDDTLGIAAGKMLKREIGCLPVINENRNVIGMITDRDICMAAYNLRKPLDEILVLNVMSRTIFTCQPDDTIEKAEHIMRTNRVRRLPIVNTEGTLAGILSLSDIALEVEREVISKSHEISPAEVSATLASVSQSNPNV